VPCKMEKDGELSSKDKQKRSLKMFED